MNDKIFVPPFCEDCRYARTLKEGKGFSMLVAYCPYRGKNVGILIRSCRKKKPDHEHQSPNLFESWNDKTTTSS